MESSTKTLPKILVVDDDPAIRKMVTMHLKQMKCEVREASDGEKGLKMLLAEKPDLLLLDVMMPELNGWEIAKYVRERAEFDDVGVIMVTAIGETVNSMTSNLYGADDYINKPFKLNELEFKIRRTLASKRKQQSNSPAAASTATSAE